MLAKIYENFILPRVEVYTQSQKIIFLLYNLNMPQTYDEYITMCCAIKI